ncbi:hypothetical protein CDL12_19025 [Handroanthus impetiginosus]|uniref:NAC domain-containing protein n=1 Tax=Handroanthus impetiginosus TaxID=429701 RepID=A0A2G9GSV0_9LAMI|nr:hypothetical protein CDL12_19025 [Handroanthus impetiginosus]
MSEDMNLSVNGHSKVPPGFRFHPTEEELLHYYLRKKVASQKIDLDVIRDVDLNKLEPWEIQEKCKIGSTPQNDWYFFSHKDKKYPTGTRTNRATAAGFWKATGRDKVIHSNFRRIGMRKTLVFYRGRAPHGQKSDWIMHEYRLDDNTTTHHDSTINASDSSAAGQEDGWVVCRVFKKKNYHKTLESPVTPRNDGVVDQILMYMGRSPPSSSSPNSCKQENEFSPNMDHDHFNNPNIQSAAAGFMHLPGLETPTMNPSIHLSDQDCGGFKSTVNDLMTDHHIRGPSSDWVALDRLVASQLNGQPCKQYSTIYGTEDQFSFPFDHMHDDAHEMQLLNVDSSDRPNDHQTETDLWNLMTRSSSSLSSSSSDPLCHLSV